MIPYGRLPGIEIIAKACKRFAVPRLYIDNIVMPTMERW